MKVYSLDLRQKIIDTYAEGGISQRQLALRFRVALSFIKKLLKQYRETQSISPKVRTAQTPSKLNDEQIKVLSSLVEADNDATLNELRCQLESQTGVFISRSTLDRTLRKLNLNLKNKPSTLPKKKVTEFNTMLVQFKQKQFKFPIPPKSEMSYREFTLAKQRCALLNCSTSVKVQEIPAIYGVITSGTNWKFLKLIGKVVEINLSEYYLTDVNKILGILAGGIP